MSVLPIEVANIFEYQDTISFGSFGTVFKIIKKSNQKYYAMKVVASSPEVCNALNHDETGLKILKELSNPYILNLDSNFKIDDKVYIVMDYCPNGDLLNAIVNKKTENQYFDENEIWKYFIQTSLGLEAYHANWLIHGDIKPQNILLDENMNVKLADIELCKCSESSSVLSDGDSPTKESDIWVLGRVLYYLCNLEDHFHESKEKIQNEQQMPIKSQYSQDLRYFVDWCLKKERNERPTINEIITHEYIVNKAVSLGIAIPMASAINRVYRGLLNSERGKNLNLENKLSESSNENINHKGEIEHLRAEIANLKKIVAIQSNDIENFRLKAVEISNFLEIYKKTLSEQQLITVENSIRALIVDTEKSKKIFGYSEQDLSCKEQEIAKSQNINTLTIENLEIKRSEILKNFNSSELEGDFRRTCLAYENDPIAHNISAMQAYQDYVNTYHQKACLFNFVKKDNETNLLIYNTETETQETKIIEISQLLDSTTCIAQLPDGKLFCFGKGDPISGITILIDENYGVQEIPSGTPCILSSTIYFNNNIYCFGGYDGKNRLTFSSRFDLERNQWNELTPLPTAYYACNSIIFNGSILISGYNKNILRYSIDDNFFSTIPYEFGFGKRKILINAERLYLIESSKGSIYESEIGSDTNWRQIENHSIIDFLPNQAYCAYNKGGIYIGCSSGSSVSYFKFNLNDKGLIRLN